MAMDSIFLKISLCLFHNLALSVSIKCPEIGCSNLMYDIRIGFMALILFFILEEADLSSFAELNHMENTCFRLLLRFQLSMSRLENCSLCVNLDEGFGDMGI